mmetsp:Transcript_66787/g.159793  ORF Transcript_66787/g.159793 Transcript_66787/m.159793 type:complete len:1008 (-) Transcript_66787:151-3174(-)
MPLEAHTVAVLSLGSWVVAGGSILLLFFLCRWGVLVAHRADHEGKVTNLQREVLVAMRAALIYQVMVIPLLVPQLLSFLPSEFVKQYCWLPFWFSFVVTTSVGSWVHLALSSCAGTLISVAATLLLNALMPGGAASPHYSPTGSVIFCTVYIYLVFLSNCSVTTKQYALALWSQVIVTFMDPARAGEAFHTVLFDWQGGIHRDGFVICQVYIVVAALGFALFALPFRPFWCCRRPKPQLYMAHSQAVQIISDLIVDTVGAMEKLLSHFRRGSSTNALQSSYLFIRTLGARRSAVETLLEDAIWECATVKHGEGFVRLQLVTGMLRGQRQVLRILLEHLKEVPFLSGSEQRQLQQTRVLTGHLQAFFREWRDVLGAIADPVYLGTGSSPDRDQAISMLARADEALLLALECLHPEGENECKQNETSFINCLRCSCTLLSEFLTEQDSPQNLRSQATTSTLNLYFFRLGTFWYRLPRLLSFSTAFGGSPAYSDAVRNTISWLLALAWCVLVRHGASSCVTSVSFVFSVTLGMLFQRNVNRMVGVALGLVFGNMPALVLINGDGTYQSEFAFFPQGLLIYGALMNLMFFGAMYGYLATGSRYSYACLLWAGFGGSFMLIHLKALAPGATLPPEDAGALFLDMMDNFVGCMLVFVVDIVYIKCFKGHASSRVAKAIPACLDDVASVVTAFRDASREVGTFNARDSILSKSSFVESSWDEAEAFEEAIAKVDTKTLQRRIAEARYWDSEVMKEDPVWTMVGKEYKWDLISEILNRCDDAYVAIFFLQLSAARSRGMAHVRDTAHRLWLGLPNELSLQASRCARATEAALTDNLFLHGNPVAQEALSEAHQAAKVAAAERRSGRDVAPALNWQLSRGLQHYDLRAEACSGAIATSLIVAARFLSSALASIEVLLREHAFWATGDWQVDVIPDAMSRRTSVSADDKKLQRQQLLPPIVSNDEEIDAQTLLEAKAESWRGLIQPAPLGNEASAPVVGPLQVPLLSELGTDALAVV